MKNSYAFEYRFIPRLDFPLLEIVKCPSYLKFMDCVKVRTPQKEFVARFGYSETTSSLRNAGELKIGDVGTSNGMDGRFVQSAKVLMIKSQKEAQKFLSIRKEI